MKKEMNELNSKRNFGMFDFAMKHPIITFLIVDEIVTLIHNVVAMKYDDDIKRSAVNKAVKGTQDFVERKAHEFEEKKETNGSDDPCDDDLK